MTARDPSRPRGRQRQAHLPRKTASPGLAPVRAVLAGAWLWALALLAGCSGIDLEPQPPSPYDLSGTWKLVEEASSAPPSSRRLRARGGMLGFITQDFPVLRASQLTIEQSRDSMGIYYDGRDYRDVSWGTRQRGLWEVRAGWHEGQLIILSEAPDARARENFTLSPDGDRLTIDIKVNADGDDVAATRTFRRAAP